MTAEIATVSFERQADGSGLIQWTVAGECDQVDITIGPGPEVLAHSHVLTVDARARRALVDRLPAGRIYVSVAPTGGAGAVVAGERRLPFEGPSNFRDLGGYRGAGGTRVRWGRVFRSDTLVLADVDLEAFGGLGIRAVYDMRFDFERDLTADRLPPGGPDVEVVSLSGNPPSQPPTTPPALSLIGGEPPADGESFLADLYRQMLEASAPGFGYLLTRLADPDRLPAVFHCTAGKDRTGMAAALLLSVLGVPEDDILDDYQLTSRYRRRAEVSAVVDRLTSENGLAPEVAAGVLTTPRWAMKGALEELKEVYGSVDGYLVDHAGVAPAVPDSLRRLLLH